MGEPQADIDAVYFPMQDADTAKPVICKVSYEYLRCRAKIGEDATNNEMLWAFETLRDEIEAVASGHYDGGRAPFVRGTGRA
jgi:Protein of unknown function (DUF1488)